MAVLGLYVLAAFIIPTLANVALVDDWVYARSAEKLVQGGGLRILDIAAPNVVFEAVWGALFGALFGVSFGVLRVASLVLMAGSGIAFYGLCRGVNVSRERSALGVAVYLFNPLSLALSYSFMTDAHFLALLVIALYFYAPGVQERNRGTGRDIAGSVAASLAFLSRPQGLLIPMAVISYLAASRKLTLSRASFSKLVKVASLPVATAAVYWLWITQIHGRPRVQAAFQSSLTSRGVRGILELAIETVFVAGAYVGLFAIPILAVLLLRRSRMSVQMGAVTRSILIAWTAFLAVGSLVVDGLMPYRATWFTARGLAFVHETLLGDSRPVIGQAARLLITIAALLSAIALAWLISERWIAGADPARPVLALLLVMAGWMTLGVLPAANYAFLSLDRYLLPLLPIAIVLALWVLPPIRLRLTTGWVLAIVAAAFSIAGMRDALVFQQTVWRTAQEALVSGVSLPQLDAGASWDGFKLGEQSTENRPIVQAGDRVQSATPNPPWWVLGFAPQIDSSYVVAAQVLRGFDVVRTNEYFSWLQGRRIDIYLLRRQPAAGIR